MLLETRSYHPFRNVWPARRAHGQNDAGCREASFVERASLCFDVRAATFVVAFVDPVVVLQDQLECELFDWRLFAVSRRAAGCCSLIRSTSSSGSLLTVASPIHLYRS